MIPERSDRYALGNSIEILFPGGSQKCQVEDMESARTRHGVQIHHDIHAV